jgi:biopolymer transport protein ExbB
MRPRNNHLLVRITLSLPLLLGASTPAFADLDDVREELTRNIQAAQRELSATQATIGRERGEIAQRLLAAQNRVLDLRERAVAARRLADEETLTLQQIETRLEVWREQSRFQSNLLAGFLDRTGRRLLSEQQAETDLRSDLAILEGHVDAQEARLRPGWQQGRVVLPDGGLADGDVLAVGPVTWFRRAEPSQSGLVRKDGELTRVSMMFGGTAHDGIEDLHRTAKGVVTFDPTLSRALLLAEDDETLWRHLQRGGIWVIPIVMFALFASVAAAAKAVWLYRLPARVPALTERVQAALGSPSTLEALTAQVQGSQAELLRIALQNQTREQRDDRLYAALLEQRNRLERWLGSIAMTASVAPLLGLLGTVSGMITTFKAMTLFGAGDPRVVSGGIAEALITTELGLVVAIPALLAHALMSRKVRSDFAQLENDAVQLSQLPVRTAET